MSIEKSIEALADAINALAQAVTNGTQVTVRTTQKPAEDEDEKLFVKPKDQPEPAKDVKLRKKEPEYTIDDVINALRRVDETFGLDVAEDLLDEFDTENAQTLDKSQYAAFIERANSIKEDS